jgi:hypothetical protein
MSLRMNLYGFTPTEVIDCIGSTDQNIQQDAKREVSRLLRAEADQAKARGWLRTIFGGRAVSLRKDRPALAVGDDGGLVITQVETEIHALALFGLVQAVRANRYLDISAESSHWHQKAVSSLYAEMSACGFFRSGNVPIEFHTWISQLIDGTPLFGDSFWSDWSYYSILERRELAQFGNVLQSAITYQREIPEEIPEDVARTITRTLSNQGKRFASDFSGWCSQLSQVGQDAFILWS